MQSQGKKSNGNAGIINFGNSKHFISLFCSAILGRNVCPQCTHSANKIKNGLVVVTGAVFFMPVKAADLSKFHSNRSGLGITCKRFFHPLNSLL